MAKQDGEFKITGTIGNLTFYKIEEEYYVRMKSSLTGKKFFKHPAFEGSRRSSERLARGSKMASEVYNSLPKAKRYYELFCALKSVAIRQLKEGKGAKDVMVRLDKELRKRVKVKRVRVKPDKRKMRPNVFVTLPGQQITGLRVRKDALVWMLRNYRSTEDNRNVFREVV